MMKVFFILVLICLLTGNVLAADLDEDNCDGANNMKISACYESILDKTDKKMNSIYQRILSVSLQSDKDSKNQWGYVKAIKSSQQDWIKFRDDECNFRTVSFEGGDIRGRLYRECQIELTRSRINNLEMAFDCLDQNDDYTCYHFH